VWWLAVIYCKVGTEEVWTAVFKGAMELFFMTCNITSCPRTTTFSIIQDTKLYYLQDTKQGTLPIQIHITSIMKCHVLWIKKKKELNTYKQNLKTWSSKHWHLCECKAWKWEQTMLSGFLATVQMVPKLQGTNWWVGSKYIH
jgi:hypothetical protein